MFFDFHSHCLPEMDDGSDGIDTSIQMLKSLKAQGVQTVACTPHYYSHLESTDHFLQRRARSVQFLLETHTSAALPTCVAGAEVTIERDLFQVNGIDQLRLGKTPYLLFEFPLAPFSDWMMEEIFNICYQYTLRPMIAHLNRYLNYFSRSELEEILSIPDVVIQINNRSLGRRSGQKFFKNLLKEKIPVVLGSDAHNTEIRPPNFDIAEAFFQKRLNPAETDRIENTSKSILNALS